MVSIDQKSKAACESAYDVAIEACYQAGGVPACYVEAIQVYQRCLARCVIGP